MNEKEKIFDRLKNNHCRKWIRAKLCSGPRMRSPSEVQQNRVKWPSSQDRQKIFRCRLITSKVTLNGQCHFILIFLHFTKLHQLRKVTLVDLDRVAPVLQVISQGFVPHMEFGGFLYNVSKIHQMCSVHSTVHTEYMEWLCRITPACQIRTMNERSHTNSVPWMHAVCRFSQVTFIQFNQKIFLTNCVHSWYGASVTAKSDFTEYKNQYKITLTSQSDFRIY